MSVYTICFCGTSCTRDEGENTGDNSDKRIYCEGTGYIPVRIHKEISGTLMPTDYSVTIRGVGAKDWYIPLPNSYKDIVGESLEIPEDLHNYVKGYLIGDELSNQVNFKDALSEITDCRTIAYLKGAYEDFKSKVTAFVGREAAALAAYASQLASSKADRCNFIGHSRGAVECIMAAWFLYKYCKKKIDINILAIDPVPGPGEWYGILTQLPPNVASYVGIYAWDHLDSGFTALVPRPNGRMINQADLINEIAKSNSWKTIADKAQLLDPLTIGNAKQPVGYELYVCRGKHSTVAGNITGDGKYDPANVSKWVEPVPKLVYKIARAYLTKWGTEFLKPPADFGEDTLQLRKKIHTYHREFDIMGGGEIRTSYLPFRPFVRHVSSIRGKNPQQYSYLEDVVGDPPYKLSYPVTKDREGEGWAKWKFL